MHPITSEMQAQLVGQDRLRSASAARRVGPVASSPGARTKPTATLVRRVLSYRRASARPCAPGDLGCVENAA